MSIVMNPTGCMGSSILYIFICNKEGIYGKCFKGFYRYCIAISIVYVRAYEDRGIMG